MFQLPAHKAALVAALVASNISSRAKLTAMWANDRRYLLDELSLLLFRFETRRIDLTFKFFFFFALHLFLNIDISLGLSQLHMTQLDEFGRRWTNELCD